MSDLYIWGDPKKHENLHECPRCSEGCGCGNATECEHACEEIDPEASSSETNSGIERDWAAGYRRGQ